MLVKGLIEQKVDIYSYRVRIPFLNKVEGDSNPTLTEDLSVATISTIPGIHSVFEEGDVVFIDFENDDFSEPVILGLLDRDSSKASYNNVDTSTLNVDLTANLPYETHIGDITPFELASLRGIKGNLQEQLSIQENTIETYMCIYNKTEFEEIDYQYNQKRALFVKVADLDGYTGTAALTRIDNNLKLAEFEGIVTDSSINPTGRKLISIYIKNDVWSYEIYELLRGPRKNYITATELSSTGTSTSNLPGRYTFFYKFRKESGGGRSLATFLISDTDDFSGRFSDLWFMKASSYQGNTRLTVKKLASNFNRTPEFGYYVDDDYVYLGILRNYAYAAFTRIVLLHSEGNDITDEDALKEHSRYDVLPSSITWIPVADGLESTDLSEGNTSPNLTIPYKGNNVYYRTFFRMDKLTGSGSSRFTFLIGPNANLAENVSIGAGTWVLSVRQTWSNNAAVIQSSAVSEIVPPANYSNKEFGYYQDDKYFYLAIKSPIYAGHTKVIPLEGTTQTIWGGLKNWDATTIQPTGWTIIPVTTLSSYAPVQSVNGKTGVVAVQHLRNLYNVSTGTAGRPTTANLVSDNYGGAKKFLATSSMTEGKPSSDGHIIHMDWDNAGNYAAQLWVSNGATPQAAIRAQRGAVSTTNPTGVWTSWLTLGYMPKYYAYNNIPTKETINNALVAGQTAWIYG